MLKTFTFTNTDNKALIQVVHAPTREAALAVLAHTHGFDAYFDMPDSFHDTMDVTESRYSDRFVASFDQSRALEFANINEAIQVFVIPDAGRLLEMSAICQAASANMARAYRVRRDVGQHSDAVRASIRSHHYADLSRLYREQAQGKMGL